MTATRVIVRELRTGLTAAILGLAAFLVAQASLTLPESGDLYAIVQRFVGPAWPFFVAVLFFLLYTAAAWIVEAWALGPPRGNWDAIGHVLHWATEVSPMVGLLATFFSLLDALLTYSNAGPGNPETQAAFIEDFAIAFGSSVAGGLLALMAFTLHKALRPD